jgi:hypothetical protein
MTGWIFGDFEQRLENILDNLLIIFHQAGGPVDIIQTWYLYQPSDIGGIQFVVNYPSRKLVPFFKVTTIDRDSPFDHLIFACFEIRDDLFSKLREIATMNEIVCLEEDGSQARLSYWIVFEIELVETMKTVGVGLANISVRQSRESVLHTCISSVSILKS